jgi:hypothetical protein
VRSLSVLKAAPHIVLVIRSTETRIKHLDQGGLEKLLAVMYTDALRSH